MGIHHHPIAHHSTHHPPQWKSEYYFIVHQDNLLFVIVFMIFLQYKIIFCIHEWMSSLSEMLLLFWFVVMYLLSSWYEMDVPVKLIPDDVWSAEDDITGSLSVGLDIFESIKLFSSNQTFHGDIFLFKPLYVLQQYFFLLLNISDHVGKRLW